MTASTIIWMILVPFFPAMHSDFQPDWELDLDKDHIKVYTRDVEGYPIKAFRAITNIKAQSWEILEALGNISGYKNWMAYCETSTIISESDGITYFHLRINSPFPAQDRDMVQSFKIIDKGPVSFDVIVSNHPDMIPEEKGYVRMPRSDGRWSILALNDSTCNVEFEMLNDPGGMIPDWLVNKYLARSPYKTLANLRNTLEK